MSVAMESTPILSENGHASSHRPRPYYTRSNTWRRGLSVEEGKEKTPRWNVTWRGITDEDIEFYEDGGEWGKFRQYLRWVDEDKDLRVLHYIDWGNEEEKDAKVVETVNTVKNIRGWVFDRHTGKCLVQGFGYPSEWEEWTKDEQESKTNILSEWTFLYSIEGTLLRLFYTHDRWYITTNKKLNAFESRWSSPTSFGNLFNQVLERIIDPSSSKSNVLADCLQSLDKTQVHYFIIRPNDDNRIVSQVPPCAEDRLYYIGFHPLFQKQLDQFTLATPLVVKDHAFLKHVRTPERVVFDVKEMTWDHLRHFVNETIPKDVYQGLFCLHKTKQVKLFSNEYRSAYHLRGTHPNLRFRYLELRKTPQKIDFVKQYPRFQQMFDECELSLEKLAKQIHQWYIQRFVQNKYINVPHEEYIVMKKCHQYYMENRQQHRIYPQTVMQYIEEEPPSQVYHMLRRLYRLEKFGPRPFSRHEVGRRRPSDRTLWSTIVETSLLPSSNHSPSVVPNMSIDIDIRSTTPPTE